jgi:hypothetical protein
MRPSEPRSSLLVFDMSYGANPCKMTVCCGKEDQYVLIVKGRKGHDVSMIVICFRLLP